MRSKVGIPPLTFFPHLPPSQFTDTYRYICMYMWYQYMNPLWHHVKFLAETNCKINSYKIKKSALLKIFTICFCHLWQPFFLIIGDRKFCQGFKNLLHVTRKNFCYKWQKILIRFQNSMLYLFHKSEKILFRRNNKFFSKLN